MPREYQRYIEPFFGGGAVFFSLQPQISIINDISDNLMQFYRYIKANDIKFKDCLYGINDEWEVLKAEAKIQAGILLPEFLFYRQNSEYRYILEKEIVESCEYVCQAVSNKSMIVDKDMLFCELCRMVKDKVFRTRMNELKNGNLSENDLADNFITGFTSGYYMFLRGLLNRIEKKHDIYYATKEYKSAIFYFVREFCYGSMFRYNKAGEFNIPYGGIGYNTKDFKKKLDLLFSKDTQEYFKNTDMYCEDFESILDMANENDFIFIDPPYDSEFSEYENRIFDEKDQRRLAQRLHNTKAKFLLIIKNTPLISELYQNNGFRVYAFDNKYSYCVKGRNDRNAVHLIVTNYDECKNI